MSKARDIATDGLGVGISSAGVSIGSSITTIDFIGVGNTVIQVGQTARISIAGGTAAGEAVQYSGSGSKSPFIVSHTHIKESITLDDATTNESDDCNIVMTESTFTVDDNIVITVGEGKTVVPDLYNVFAGL
tara:strand:- start:3379 stop:3774 length:396 start_codon:yes stop_codon:yes gene_type:complete